MSPGFGMSPEVQGWSHAAVPGTGQELSGPGRAPIREAEELFPSPNVNKKLPAV